MPTIKKGVLGQVAGLLQKFQDRLDKYDTETTNVQIELGDARKKFQVAVLACQTAVRQFNDLAEKLTKQDETNKEVAASLYNLKESTQKAFDNVRADYKALLDSQQRLNERISKLESLNYAQRDYEKVNNLEVRVSAVENVLKAAKVLIGLVSKV